MDQLPPLPVGLTRAAAIFALALASAFVAAPRTTSRFVSPPPSPPFSPIEPAVDGVDPDDDLILESNDESLLEVGRLCVERLLVCHPAVAA
jgi:hypothetical protein